MPNRYAGMLCLMTVALLCAAPIYSAPEDPVGYEEWYMNEEWYDWHERSDFAEEDGALRTEVHFVGPGAPTPRGVYVRSVKGADWSKVSISLTDPWRGEIEPGLEAIDAAGTPGGKQWFRLGRQVYVRGFSDLVLAGEDIPEFDYVLVSPNERYLTHGRAERYIEDYEKAGRSFAGVIRCGMPMGGAGAGKVEIARDGTFRNLTTNNNLDTPFYHPEGCFMAIRANNEARVLQTRSQMGLEPIQDIDFRAHYPIARLQYADQELPVEVNLTGWSPVVPLNVEDSSLPVAVLDFEIRNKTKEALDTSLAVSWENLLGSTGRPQPSGRWGSTGHYIRVAQPDGNTQEFEETPFTSGIHFRGYDKKDPDSIGNYTLAAPKDERFRVTALTEYRLDEESAFGWAGWTKDGDFHGSSNRQGQWGALSIRVRLEPEETIRIPVVFAWYMEHQYQMGREDMGHYYHNEFADSREIAQYVLAHRGPLFEQTEALERQFAESNLPDWVVDMVLNDAYVYSTDTYLTKDGRFTVNEGAGNMYGVMGTMDQKLYASQYYALFFPTLQKRELLEFARLQNDNGWITHDVGVGEFTRSKEGFDWPDLNMAFMILSYQMLQTTGDLVFWEMAKPHVNRALESLDNAYDLFNVKPYEGRVNPGGGSTFDDEDAYPLFSYHAGLYLCVLEIGQQMAREAGDTDYLATLEERERLAREEAMEHLWNGKYFVYGAYVHEGTKSTSSHFSQLAGSFFSNLLGFGGVYDKEVRDQALDSLLTMHGNRKFALPPKIVTEDGELFPRSGPHRAAPVSWPLHSRPAICGNAFYYGREQDGWDLLKHMHESYREANGPDPWDQSLYYDPITGELDWGVFYMTGPASWLAYQALVGVDYDVTSASLLVRPAIGEIDPQAKAPVFSPVFWATMECDGPNSITLTLDRIPAGVLALKEVRIPDTTEIVKVAFDNREIEGTLNGQAYHLNEPLRMEAGGVLQITW